MDLQTTIVGAGPYGLSIAAHLRAARIPFEMFGTPLESWRRYMPEGMTLKSERFASNLWDPKRSFTLERYCQVQRVPYQPVGDPLSLSLFLEYAEWFRRNTAVESNETKVTAIRQIPRGFALALADGRTLTSQQVVLATGHMAFHTAPPELSALPEPLVLHSSRIGDVSTYARRDVVIIGAGQSALETAALLHEAGACVHLLARSNQISWNAPSKPRHFLSRILAPDAGVASGWKSLAISELPGVFRIAFSPNKRHRFVAGSYGPSGAWWLRDRVDGRITLSLSSRIELAERLGNQVSLRLTTPSGPREIVADHVIAATGFRVDIDRLEYLDSHLRRAITQEAAGIPALNFRFETSVPGLFVVGVASSPVFGPIMRFMYGAKHVAPTLAHALRT